LLSFYNYLNWLIDWCLTSTLAIFQLYCGNNFLTRKLFERSRMEKFLSWFLGVLPRCKKSELFLFSGIYNNMTYAGIIAHMKIVVCISYLFRILKILNLTMFNLIMYKGNKILNIKIGQSKHNFHLFPREFYQIIIAEL
jgi:hypothetical protein